MGEAAIRMLLGTTVSKRTFQMQHGSGVSQTEAADCARRESLTSLRTEAVDQNSYRQIKAWSKRFLTRDTRAVLNPPSGKVGATDFALEARQFLEGCQRAYFGCKVIAVFPSRKEADGFCDRESLGEHVHLMFNEQRTVFLLIELSKEESQKIWAEGEEQERKSLAAVRDYQRLRRAKERWRPEALRRGGSPEREEDRRVRPSVQAVPPKDRFWFVSVLAGIVLLVVVVLLWKVYAMVLVACAVSAIGFALVLGPIYVAVLIAMRDNLGTPVKVAGIGAALAAGVVFGSWAFGKIDMVLQWINRFVGL